MDYSFNLEFEELSEELQNQKIDEVITYDYENGNLDTEIEDQPLSLDSFLDDMKLRKEVEETIKAHFPLYF